MSNRIKTSAILLASAVFAALLSLAACSDNDDNDDDAASCTEEFCLAWCIENFWPDGLDAGVQPWSSRRAVCLNDQCSCEESLCNPENCAAWCKSAQGKASGHCDMFDCVCDG